MRERIDLRLISTFVLIVLCALPLLGSRAQQIHQGQSVFIVAARDSHLLTMCPTLEPVRFPDGRTWKADGRASLVPFENDESITFYNEGGFIAEGRLINEGHFVALPVFLPLPAGGTGKGMPVARPVPGRVELNRVAPDPEIKRRIEKEFLRRKEFVLVDSPAKADLVFLAEGTYAPMQIGKITGLPDGKGIATGLRGDYKAEFLQSVFAIVVPAASFSPTALEGGALVNERLWEGSAIWQRIWLAAAVKIAPASPEAVVAQFHNKEKRPPNHFPLCAASALPLKMAGTTMDIRSGVPAFKKDANPLPVPPAVEPKQAGESQAIRVEVTLVTVPVTVSDQDGKRISDLAASDFRLFEDDIEQKIDRVIPEPEPFDVALMLDTSPSMRLKADQILDSALAFSAAVRPTDRIMFVSFDNRIWVQSVPSADRVQLRAALSWMRSGDGTRLYDAVDLVLEDRLIEIRGRKAIVLFTDGVDTRSRIAAAADTLAAIEESNVLVYAIQYDTSQENAIQPFAGVEAWVILPEDLRNNSERYARADKYLFSLCNGSGGQLYLASEGSNLAEVFARIADQLSHQFTLSYYPTNPRHDGSFHRLRVEVNRPGARVRSRIGYRESAKPASGK